MKTLDPKDYLAPKVFALVHASLVSSENQALARFVLRLSLLCLLTMEAEDRESL